MGWWAVCAAECCKSGVSLHAHSHCESACLSHPHKHTCTTGRWRPRFSSRPGISILGKETGHDHTFYGADPSCIPEHNELRCPSQVLSHCTFTEPAPSSSKLVTQQTAQYTINNCQRVIAYVRQLIAWPSFGHDALQTRTVPFCAALGILSTDSRTASEPLTRSKQVSCCPSPVHDAPNEALHTYCRRQPPALDP